MIVAMVTGTLARDAELKLSAKGKEYALMVIRVDDQTFVRCSLFGDDAKAGKGLRRGDSLSVTGNLQVSVWSGKVGKAMPSLAILANRLISPVLRSRP